MNDDLLNTCNSMKMIMRIMIIITSMHKNKKKVVITKDPVKFAGQLCVIDPGNHRGNICRSTGSKLSAAGTGLFTSVPLVVCG